MENKFISRYLNKLNFLGNPELELKAILNNCSIIENEIFLSNFCIKNIDIKKFKSAIKKRIKNEPISKIFNKKEFWSLDFYVNKNVLDPRPETELLIENIKKNYLDFKSKIKICDLGTGSGCIAITLAKNYINSSIVATDISQKAIKVAKKNAIEHDVISQIKFINCDWIKDKKTIFDIVVANPPYLTEKEYTSLDDTVKKFDPKISLYGGKNGVECYKEISKFIDFIIDKNSFIFFEIGSLQKESVINIFDRKNIKTIEIVKDYNSNNRILVLKKGNK